jgi:adenylate cyclase
VFTTGEALIVHDAPTDERFNRAIDEQTGYATKSVACVPIRAGEAT